MPQILSALQTRWVKLWPALVFIPALMTIAHAQHWKWFTALDSYYFTRIGGIVAISYWLAPDEGCPTPIAVVITIDDKTFENKYAERSPLDRCVLRDHLQQIYDQEPQVLAIDLDLSPVFQFSDESRYCELRAEVKRQVACEHELYKQIKSSATKTVLIEPLKGSDKKDEWVKEMEKAGVRFGSADLPVQYGLALRSFNNAQALSHAVNNAAGASIDADSYDLEKKCWIHPRNYWPDGIRAITFPELSAPKNKKCVADLKDQVVFFGGGYGGGQYDTFLTPIGEVAGVDVHAAAYTSLLRPAVDLAALFAFLLDVLIAFAFGIGF